MSGCSGPRLGSDLKKGTKKRNECGPKSVMEEARKPKEKHGVHVLHRDSQRVDISCYPFGDEHLLYFHFLLVSCSSRVFSFRVRVCGF